MNIFSSIRVYPGKWFVSNKRAFTQEEIAAVSHAEVVDSQYGYSVCCHMYSGGTAYIPLSTTSSLTEGDIVDLSKASLLTLSREGEDDIFRVEA